MKCQVEDCDREAVTKKYGNLCLMHYKRKSRHGDVNTNKQDEKILLGKQRIATKCKYCNNEVGRGGVRDMCNKHYQMFRSHGDALHSDNRERSTSHGYFRTGKNGQGEHRKVYESYIGRKLESHEIVHHIDFNKINNNIENLWLYGSQSEHTKQHCNHRSLMKKIKDDETIIFKDGIYYITKI